MTLTSASFTAGDRDRAIDHAIATGRITEAKRPFYERMWALEPVGTSRQLTAAPAEGGLPPTSGVSPDEPLPDSVSILVPVERQRAANIRGTASPVDASLLTPAEYGRLQRREQGNVLC